MHPNSSASIYILHSGYSDPPFLAASANPKNNSGVNKWFGGWGDGEGDNVLILEDSLEVAWREMTS